MIENVTHVHSAELEGIEARIVRIEMNLKRGIPRFQIVGQAGGSTRESNDRVRIAIENSGFHFPMQSILVNLSPAGVKKEASWFDLGIATALLRLSGQIDPDISLDKVLFLGELGLDGSVKPIRGLSNILLSQSMSKFTKVVFPLENRFEASVCERLKLFPISHLSELESILSDPEKEYKEKFQFQAKIPKLGKIFIFRDQLLAFRALNIAVSGKHHALLIGVPGAGKTMLARLMGSLQPPLNRKEFEEILKVRSSSEFVYSKEILEISRPFRSPHHTSSDVSLIGGGKVMKVGEVTLAHNGILFLDEVGEFKPQVIQALREPLEDRKVTLSRVNYHQTLPAGFLFLGATNPCPCGYLGSAEYECRCTPQRVQKYISRLSGPFLDRIDFTVRLEPFSRQARQKVEVDLDEIYKKIDLSKKIQEERYKDSSFHFNGELPGGYVERFCEISSAGKKLMEKFLQDPSFSLRRVLKIQKISRTIADLDAKSIIEESHILEAYQFMNHEYQFLKMAA
jgi:magnesium chelatase family protein